MSKTKTTNLIVIDASGSMKSKAEEVIGGLKQLFGDIRKDGAKDVEKVNVTTIVLDFSDAQDINVLTYNTDPSELSDSIADLYKVRGMTALYDAVGQGFSLIPKDSDSVFVNILTDGEENDSKRYSSNDIKELFKKADSKNWAVTFMGTTKASVENAEKLGVAKGNTFTFADTKDGVISSINKLKGARTSYYAANSGRAAGQTLSMDNLMDDESKK